MYGYVYLTTNKINNKKYIGKHKSESFDESYKGSGIYLNHAINKYGKDNFVTEILEWCETREELNQREQYYIDYHNAIYRDDFYNIAHGGEGGDTYSGLSEKAKLEFKDKIRSRWADENYINSCSLRTKNRWKNSIYKKVVSQKISSSLRGVSKSDEHKKNLSISLRKNGSHAGKKNSMYGVDRSGEKAPNYGRHYYNNGTEEYLLYEDVYESEYKDKGFIKGRLQYKLDALHKGLSKRLTGNTYTKGRIRIHKDNLEKLIYPEQLESYVLEGWLKGRRPKVSK